MKDILLIVGAFLLLGGMGLLKRGRGGKMTNQGCSSVLIGIVLLIVGMTISPGSGDDESKKPSHDNRVVSSVSPTVDISQCTLGAVFQEDVSVPDDTRIEAGERFTKTWRIRNTGTCDWGNGFYLVFTDGDEMGGIKSVPIPETRKGEDAEVSVSLIAPVKAGTYRGNWRICVEKHQCFGDVLYVRIVVADK